MEVGKVLPQWSITEVYNPLYRKVIKTKTEGDEKYYSTPKSQNSQSKNIDSGICKTFSNINSCISNLEEMFQKRMVVHEEQIIQIAHSELRKIETQARKVVEKYSQLIREKNLSVELLDLKYEVLYYQKKAGQMFEENKVLKQKIKLLNQQLLSRKIGEESDHIALQNISKKYLKEKTLKHKLLQNINFKRDTDNTTSLTNNKLLALTKHINPENSETKHEHRLLRATGNSDFITLLRTGSSDYNTRDRSLKIKSKKIGSHICTTPI